MPGTVETFEFQTETKRLLDLMIHSIYSNKDIFLRELISNSSDALDRRRFEAVKHPEMLPEGTELEIRIETDPDARTLSVVDTGIGMSRDELISLIGTIAKSGTKEFIATLQQAKDKVVPPELIGQFGVGFYSSFMVADEVTVETRKAGEEGATKWHSDGSGTYTLEEIERDEPGTTVTLHLKSEDEEDGLQDYSQEWVVKNLVRKYSDFVAYPIKMDVERTEVERDETGQPKEGAEEKTVVKTETLNSMKALWLRDKKDVSDDELTEFYKHISHDWSDPLHTIWTKIEGTLEYRLLLFIPSQAPFDLYHPDREHGLRLYVKRVFIMDNCRELMPNYLRFVKGVVDSEDLSLNISREMLQKDRQIQRMRKGIVKKVLDTLKELREKDDETYRKFWSEFGTVLKEGLFEDFEHRDELLELLLAESTNDSAELTSLDEYIERMKDDQEFIYYMTGESRKAIEGSPHLEAFRDKGYEVLILADNVDEVWLRAPMEYKDKKFKSVGQGEAELGTKEEREEEEKKRKEKQEEYGSLLSAMKDHLDEYVKEVRISARLKQSPSCLVGETGDMTPQMEQLMKAMGQDVPTSKRILELNGDHEVVKGLHKIFEENKDDPRIAEYSELLYGQALLAEGSALPEPGKFATLLSDLMAKSV